METIFQLAKYITGRLETMTTVKTHKLCYYCQAWSLAWDGLPLIPENFEAWANGPVCPQLYHFHKGKYTLSADDFKSVQAGTFTESQLETIDKVLDYYGDKETHWLSDLTHKEAPWLIARAKAGVAPGERCTEVITPESMQEYYGGLQ